MTSPPLLDHFPPLNPVDIHPNDAPGPKSPELERSLPDPDRLAPEDAYFAPALSRVRSAPANYEDSLRSLNGDNASHIGSAAALRKKLGGAPRRRKRKGAWKKLLWVKQSCMFLCAC
jgi:phosphatidylinositol glycan class C protein